MGRFLRLVRAITYKDWLEHRFAIALITGLECISMSVRFAEPKTRDFAGGVAAGGLLAAAFVYAHSSFDIERKRGTLGLLLSLPAQPFSLVIAKYASMCSMLLFTINVPGVFLGDWRLLLRVNAALLLISTFFLMSSVVSESFVASQVPLFVLVGIYVFANDVLRLFFSSRSSALPVSAMAVSQLIAVASAAVFARQQQP